MKKPFLFCLVFMMVGLATVNAQQKTTPPPKQKEGVQNVVSVAPQMLPQAIRDSIDHHMVDRDALITSAREMTQAGDLIYEVNFEKDGQTWSKKYDDQGRHIDDNYKREDIEELKINYY